MPKATINLPDGTNITVDGNEAEVSRIVALISRSPSDTVATGHVNKSAKPMKAKANKSVSGNGTRRPGLTTYVLELKDEGYFKKERSLDDVLEALKQIGHIYPVTSLSETMLRLTRQKKLGRIDQGSKWVYVHRD